MKKQKKRTAQKRLEKRREKRRKRKQSVPGAPGTSDQAHRSTRSVHTWATDPLALSVSGQGAVAALVRETGHGNQKRSGSPRAWLIGVRIDLLAGGYLGTHDMRLVDDLRPEDLGPRLFGELYQPYGKYLVPTPAPVASRLVWGALAYSASREALPPVEDAGGHSTDGLGAIPALGYLRPPTGNPESWLVDFLGRFRDSQVDVADTLLLEEPPGTAFPELDVAVGLETEMPLTARAELDRRPQEFVPKSLGSPILSCLWVPPPAHILAVEPRQPRGLLWLHPSGMLVVNALDVTGAADMVMRLKELIPSIRLRGCRWSWAETRPEEEADDLPATDDLPVLSEELDRVLLRPGGTSASRPREAVR